MIWDTCTMRKPDVIGFEVMDVKTSDYFTPVVKVTCPVVMVALWNRTDHYIFALRLLLSFVCLSSPNLSRRRLDVCHTSTHGVALVRISDAGLKPNARGSLKTQDAKKSLKSPSGHHRTTLSGYIFATKARINNPEKTICPPHVLIIW